MGKTLTNIALVAAAVAVNVIPGVGQAISLGLATSGLGLGVGATLAVVNAITLTVTAAGIAGGLSLLGLGPSIPKPDTTQTAIKTSRPPRISCTGRARLHAYAELWT